jgi:hypothetical protein
MQNVFALLVMPLHKTDAGAFYKYKIHVKPAIAVYKSGHVMLDFS